MWSRVECVSIRCITHIAISDMQQCQVNTRIDVSTMSTFIDLVHLYMMTNNMYTVDVSEWSSQCPKHSIEKIGWGRRKRTDERVPSEYAIKSTREQSQNVLSSKESIILQSIRHDELNDSRFRWAVSQPICVRSELMSVSHVIVFSASITRHVVFSSHVCLIAAVFSLRSRSLLLGALSTHPLA